MGISGLLPLLKSIHKQCHLRQFAGQTIGVDAYGWLHRGTVACAIDLALDKPTRKHIDYCMHRVRMLIHFGIKPYLVFDGDHLPGKEVTNRERAAKRKESKKQGMELMRLGKTSQAHLELQKAVDVTPEMARMLIEELKQLDIEYVVAPYEADSQLAYLERKGIIHGIVSEDSDLLVFGAKCLITKLDNYGECVVINRKDFTACKDISLVGWSDAQFRQMAILSGCDYLPSINKMGLMTAYRLLRKHKTVDRILRQIQFDGKFKVPAGYPEAYNQAEMTFLYQWVFCPLANRLMHYTEPDSSINVDELLYIGRYFDPKVAVGVARGDLHPNTKQPIVLPESFRTSKFPTPLHRRTSMIAQTPELKKSKSIDSFFKPKRIPLAELDPNLFTPSPTQQQTLQENRGTWNASPAPSQPQQPRPNPLSASVPHQGSRRVVSEPWPTRRSSTSHPAKRQRLCSDTLVIPGADGSFRVESGSSRFFASTEPSPSARGSKSKRKAAKQEFDLWSDDSLEEAMLDIPDPSQNTTDSKGKANFAVFAEEAKAEVSTIRESQKTEASQLSRSVSMSTMQDSQSTGRSETPATSYDSQPPLYDSQTSTLDEDDVEGFKELARKFAHRPDSIMPVPTGGDGKKRKSIAQTIDQVLSQPSTSASLSGEFSWSKKDVEVSNSLREGAGAAANTPRKKRNSVALQLFESESPSLPTTPKIYNPDLESEMLSDAAWAAHDAAVVVPRSSQVSQGNGATAADSRQTPAKEKSVVGKAGVGKPVSATKGSEDVDIIPDSESEGAFSDVEVDRVKAMKQKLDLERFRFSAAN